MPDSVDGPAHREDSWPGPTEPWPAPAPDALVGTRVVVTRARAQASGLVLRLTGLGATVVELPVIAIEDPVDGGAALGAAADRLVAGAYEWVVVTSTNAVTRLVDALDGRSAPAATRWAAVGTSTAHSLMGNGIVPDLVPSVAVSNALVDVFPEAALAGAAPGRGTDVGSALFVRAERVRDVVAPGLGAKGWQVDEAVAYRTAAGVVDPHAVEAARSADAVAFTSSSTVERTVDLLGRDGVPAVIASIGPVTSESVRGAGLTVTVEAFEHTLDGLVAAIAAALADHTGGAVPEAGSASTSA
jgi:uroporphyrinogen III methyltransferase/synthase